MVEDLPAVRRIIVSHQTVRLWAEKFGRTFANEIRRRSSGRLGDKWHLDEAVVSIRGKKHWLWRAVDQDGFVLEVLVQSHRNTKAAKRLMRKLLKGQGQSPRVMITDKLRSYSAAKREIMPGVEHRSHKGLNNRAENSHQPRPPIVARERREPEHTDPCHDDGEEDDGEQLAEQSGCGEETGEQRAAERRPVEPPCNGEHSGA